VGSGDGASVVGSGEGAGEGTGEGTGVVGAGDGASVGGGLGAAVVGAGDGAGVGSRLGSDETLGAGVRGKLAYQAIVSSPWDAERTSMSPSPSTSMAKTSQAWSAESVMTRSVKDWDPSFSYHETVSALNDAESAST
jgi:hypothetical protein